MRFMGGSLRDREVGFKEGKWMKGAPFTRGAHPGIGDRGSGIGALALSFPSLFGKLELGGEGGVIGMVSSEQ
jgi:hypothetical protein